MKKCKAFGIIAVIAVFACSCGLFKTPSITAGYYIANEPDSKATLVMGSNGTQANAIHAALPDVTAPAAAGDVEAPVADGKAKKTVAGSGLFNNITVGDRSADFDTSAAVQALKEVQSSTAGQNSGRDQSPNNNQQSPNTTDDHTKETSIPLTVN